MTRSFLFRAPAVLGASLMLLSAPAAWAGNAAKGQRPAGAGAAEEETAVDVAGATVAVDKDGKLRPPTREEAAALVAAMGRFLDQGSEGLQVRVLPDGSKTVDLQDRFQDVALAKVEGGRVVTACVGTAAEATAFLRGSQTPAPRAKKAAAKEVK